MSSPDFLARAAEANVQHLNFLEVWSQEVPPFEVAGVNIPGLFTYELIQLLNNGWLAANQEQEISGDEPATESVIDAATEDSL